MKTFMLILTLYSNDFVVDHGLSYDDCRGMLAASVESDTIANFTPPKLRCEEE